MHEVSELSYLSRMGCVLSCLCDGYTIKAIGTCPTTVLLYIPVHMYKVSNDGNWNGKFQCVFLVTYAVPNLESASICQANSN